MFEGAMIAIHDNLLGLLMLITNMFVVYVAINKKCEHHPHTLNGDYKKCEHHPIPLMVASGGKIHGIM